MRSYLKTFMALLASLGCLASCEQNSPKKDETVIITDDSSNPVDSKTTMAKWRSTLYLDPLGKQIRIEEKNLAEGGPKDPLSVTYAKANAPLALFKSSAKGEKGDMNDIPFLAFEVEDKASVTIRHIKTLNGQNVVSQLIIPSDCPNLLVEKGEVEPGKRLYCIPLINAVIPNFLVPSDNSGSYVHEFTVSVKFGGKAGATLTTKVACTILIPESNLTVAASKDLRNLGLADRLTISTNDLLGSPRRDFRAFLVEGKVAPGVQTSWVLTLSDVILTLEEELFFELPVSPGDNPSKPTVSRGSAFYKRKTSINSRDHFRLRLLAGSGDNINAFNISRTGNTVIDIPIEDGTAPLRVFISPDFANETATKSMSEYVRPFGPTFCPKENAAFKPEEWRKSRQNKGYIACEAFARTRLIDQSDALKKGITSPIETFFGSFSYLPRLGNTVLGGTNGVLSLRVSLSGTLKAAVRNPHAPETTTQVGLLKLDTSYFFPTAISEMDAVIKSGAVAPGLDTIYSAMLRRGIQELPRRNGGKLPAFPFQGENRDDAFH